MDIKNKYTHYSADQLLNDFYFLESEQHPSPESIAFWETMQQKDKALAKEIKIARSFLHDIRHIPVSHLPQNEVETVWKNISRLNNIEKQRKNMSKICPSKQNFSGCLNSVQAVTAQSLFLRPLERSLFPPQYGCKRR